MPDADKPEFAKQSFKGFVMRIMMMMRYVQKEERLLGSHYGTAY